MKSSAAGAVGGERLGHRRLDSLDGERRAVDDEAVAASRRTPKQLPGLVHPGLGSPLRAPDPGELGGRLDPAPLVEELPVDRDLDALVTQPVGEPERERLRHDGARHAERLHRSNGNLLPNLAERAAGRDQLVGAELLERMELEGADRREPRDLHRTDCNVAHPSDLGVQEGVRHAERDLVPKLRRAKRIGVNEDVGHGSDSN